MKCEIKGILSSDTSAIIFEIGPNTVPANPRSQRIGSICGGNALDGSGIRLGGSKYGATILETLVTNESNNGVIIDGNFVDSADKITFLISLSNNP